MADFIAFQSIMDDLKLSVSDVASFSAFWQCLSKDRAAAKYVALFKVIFGVKNGKGKDDEETEADVDASLRQLQTLVNKMTALSEEKINDVSEK
jgi:hypothetical protein